ncbi:MAG: putative lipid II flippase FtsW [Pseudonocardiales bacterium]|nr:putative lipid II flippase FtsW [Pseudonocardiales bacterium]MBV9649975.1 putative lipid II flippase FtsW [Pseudonocardiales bacterium]
MRSSTRPGTPASRPAQGHQPRQPSRQSGARKRVGPAVWNAARAQLTAWLARPLTSLHLVVGVFGLLTLFGLVMVLSASNVESYTKDGSSYAVFLQQLAFCGLGLVLFWLGMRMPVRMLRGTSGLFLLACVALLVVVLSPLGAQINGAQKWLRLGPLSLQPSEPAKLALALWGAHVLVTKHALLHQWRHLLVPLVPMAVTIFALVMLQPDLGTTITLAIVLLALLWFGGAPGELFGAIAITAVAGAVAMAGLAGYRSARIQSFLHPLADPQGTAYQARQAMFSLADGGVWGVGLGQGSAKWDYLPNAHNDFIFAIIGEELGFVGCLVVLLLFGTLAYVGIRIAARNTDPWIKLVSATVTAWLVGQAAINIGYVVGLLPVTGIPLPLISSGGTSIALTMLVFGLLANFARHEPQAVAALRQDSVTSERRHGLLRLLCLRPPVPYSVAAATPRSPGLSSGGRS